MPALSAPEGEPVRSRDALMQSFEHLGYIADRSLATAVYLITKLQKPLLIEGHAGLGKTGSGQGSGVDIGNSAHPAAVLRRAGRQLFRLRVELSEAVTGHQDSGRNGADGRRKRKTHLQPGISARAA